MIYSKMLQFLVLSMLLLPLVEASNSSKAGCSIRFQDCPTLNLCPESYFEVQLGSNKSSGCSDWQRMELIKRITRVPLKCKKLRSKIRGKLIGVRQKCYFRGANGIYYAPSTYCLMRRNEANVCEDSLVVSKCCSVDQVYDDKAKDCRRGADEVYLPHIGTWQNASEGVSNTSELLSFQIQPYHRNLSSSSITTGYTSRFYMTDSDVLYSPLTGVFLRGQFKPLSMAYCLESLRSALPDVNGSIRLFYDNTIEIDAHWYAIMVGIIWLSSIPFDLVTAVAHIFILRRCVHGALLASYLISGCLVRYTAAFITFKFYNETSNTNCTFVDFFQKVMYMCTLTWITLINFNMWVAFRKLHHSRGGGMCLKYLGYAFIAIAFPCLIVFITYKVGQYFRTPGNPCVLYMLPSLVTFSTPIVTLITINFLLFLRTLWNIKLHQRATENILQKSYSLNRKSFKLFAKLFLMTGPIWLVRVILLFYHIKQWYLTICGGIFEFIFISPNIIFFFYIFTDRETLHRIERVILRCRGKQAPDWMSSSGLERCSTRRPNTVTTPAIHTISSSNGGERAKVSHIIPVEQQVQVPEDVDASRVVH